MFKGIYFLALSFALVSILTFGIFSSEAFAQSGDNTIILLNATVIDGVSDKPIKNVHVVVKSGKIQEIASGAPKPAKGAKVIDLKGQYLMPGLIDAHVHIRTFDAARRALLSGVTTARSMGVSHFADVGFRKLAQAGKIESPEILAAGYHVRPKPADAFFMDRPDLAGLMGSEVRGVEAMRKMARAMIASGVNWIKTNATARAGLPQTDPRQPYY
ncbi:MAG: hypothetical protein ACE5G1_01340, partial [bacterium]